jgi:dipeptide/tripeptide permease
VLHRPDHLEQMAGSLSEELRRLGAAGAGLAWLRGVRADLERKVSLEVVIDRGLHGPWQLESQAARTRLRLRDAASYRAGQALVLAQLRDRPGLGGLLAADLDDQVNEAGKRPFLLLFLGLLFAVSLLVLELQRRFQTGRPSLRALLVVGTLALVAATIWLVPYLSFFARVLCTVIGSTVVALYAIQTREVARFRDHFRFLLMIFIYSGFWVLYFQMFDAVLWYVQAYVDASSLDAAVNTVLTALGVSARWHFDIEHVTVINAGTIILLQLLISSLVKNTRALPTMVAGIGFGTLGMAVLALSTGIWVFILGITIFSIGEMTAHPKFIAYVGQTAPKSRVALYMGYLFLYGVVGSSIGGVLGARLYVRFVDELNRPRALWLIFAGIGLCTMIGLLIYNRFAVKEPEARARS